MILPTGIVLGGLLGFRHAPAVVGADHLRLRVVAAFALQALLIGSLAVGLIAVLADQATGLVAPASPVEITIQSLSLAAFGILFLGGAIGPLLVLLATAWAWLLRRLWARRTILDGP